MLGDLELNRIYTGDARQLGKRIPDSSVDLIYCDPQYDRMADYAWLAMLARRILKPGGSLVAQVGNIYRYDAETAIRSIGGLVPQPLLLEQLVGGHSKLWKARVFAGHKPYLWFSKGERTIGTWIPDLVKGGGRDKEVHEWGDSPRAAMIWIERLVPVHGIVVDPFTGSGMVPYVCTQLQRNYIAYEIQPQVAQKARDKLKQVQLSYVAFEPEQLGLIYGSNPYRGLEEDDDTS